MIRRARARLPALELAVYGALGALALVQWSRLVADPPTARLALCLAAVLAGAAALAALRPFRERRPRLAFCAAAGIAAATVGAAIAAVGFPARLLLPGNWSELIESLSLGLAGIEDTTLPYGGDDRWLRLTLLLGGPLLLALGAIAGFWPARRRGLLRVLALGAAAVVYAIAVTLDSPTAELLWGVPVLILAVAWLWAARLPARRALTGVAAALAAGLVALPAAAAVAGDDPWWNYESWDWFSRDREISFNWDHSYGPLDWPQEGTTLLDVRSPEPFYWRASVLDRFDGLGWLRARPDDALATAELAARRAALGANLGQRRREWLAQASFEVEALTSNLVVAPGTPLALEGITDVRASADGTLASDDGLAGGDEYSVLSYAPQPRPAQLREAPAAYPRAQFADQVLVALPRDGAPAVAQPMSLWGEAADPRTESRIAASPYAGTYELARELTAGAEHPYEAALAIEDHLREGYDYSTQVDESTYSLATFLEDDRTGYCQQFAGSMALMLRLVGIPSRVVSGFAPGSYDSERNVYEVRDTDAHAWVEVYFRGVGWVVFDPTPAAAPAASRTPASEADPAGAAQASADAGDIGPLQRSNLQGPEVSLGDGSAPAGGDGIGPGGIAFGVIAAALAALGAVAAWRWRSRRRILLSGAATEAQLAELREGLRRLGWRVGDSATLAQLEGRFGGAGRQPVARYAAALRAHRFGPEGAAAPGPGERRALRRALAADGGLRRRLLALRAIPPGGPRPVRR